MSRKDPNSSSFDVLRAAAGVDRKSDRGAYGVSQTAAQNTRRKDSVRRVILATTIGVALLAGGGFAAWWMLAPGSPRQADPSAPVERVETVESTESTAIESESESEAATDETAGALPPADLQDAATRQQISDLVLAWAEAWTDRDADALLALYSSDFQTSDGRDLEAWSDSVERRMGASEWLRVSVVGLKMSPAEEGGADVSFTETRRTPDGERVAERTLRVIPTDADWAIVGERSD